MLPAPTFHSEKDSNMIINFDEVVKAFALHNKELTRSEETWEPPAAHHRLTETRESGYQELYQILRAAEASPFSDDSVWWPTLWRVELGAKDDQRATAWVLTEFRHLPDTLAIAELDGNLLYLGGVTWVRSVSRSNADELRQWYHEQGEENAHVNNNGAYIQVPADALKSSHGMDVGGRAAHNTSPLPSIRD